ncbi:hypothetical protein Vadar_009478 [Vaccinium darrowii]|uniref:Uncharacterized protein n=1 Tax=Vaccinium darrowii TaxID=229202 RepID=A0ACB7XQH1_9ERIC|nr:hypothetical protein Vadar_009478 [Vaccinium darrowii]
MTDQTVGECSNPNTSVSEPTAEDRIASLVAEKAVVIFSISTCAMGVAVKALFNTLKANATVYELDRYPWGKEMERVLIEKNGSIPVVYIGGKLVGDTKRVMDSHIKGDLAKLIKDAGAPALLTLPSILYNI